MYPLLVRVQKQAYLQQALSEALYIQKMLKLKKLL